MSVYEGTLFELLKEVVKSWQVIAVTIVLVIYISLVNRAARVYKYKRSKPVKKLNFKKKAKAKTKAAEVVPVEEESGGSSNDELGLES